MQGVMQDPKKIDLSSVPSAEIQNLVETFLGAVDRFYSDPGNEARFQEWMRRRKVSSTA